MTQKKGEQFRLILGLTDESDLQTILYNTLESDIWAPIRITKEELEEKYYFYSLPENMNYETILLISSFSKESLNRFTEKIKHEDIDMFISVIF